jgi:large subunit ribosomal protein L18
MMRSKAERNSARLRRKRRVRKKVNGTAERPRLSVFRSNRHIYGQLVDDDSGRTIASASSLEEAVSGDKKEQATAVGKLIAERGKSAGVQQVVFDRNGFLYHGRIAAVAEGAREGGLEF